MKGMKAALWTAWIMVLAMIAGSMTRCATDECYDNKTALPYAGFYGMVDTLMQSVKIDSLEVYGLGAPGDSVLSDGKSALTTLYLPFRIDSDTTTYVFRILRAPFVSLGIADTVTFVYDREPRFVSGACGVSYLYKIKDIRTCGLLIDSVVCPDMEISNADKENIQIYFHTGEGEEEARIPTK